MPGLVTTNFTLHNNPLGRVMKILLPKLRALQTVEEVTQWMECQDNSTDQAYPVQREMCGFQPLRQAYHFPPVVQGGMEGPSNLTIGTQLVGGKAPYGTRCDVLA